MMEAGDAAQTGCDHSLSPARTFPVREARRSTNCNPQANSVSTADWAAFRACLHKNMLLKTR
eukprot:CAMPEP_0183815806 /NCGR_PEP_ID=MMETSP0803_2-20130417/57538_1 /TAXON_ID=195967 /ORGANISM="Crustomastix stigmata, Strain CCMP3273" /LENGTH=61 /DNA_ID=CAMNT_0026060667 /DNA_START=162 /DNA_END=344 /DNA_ORIENTATION=+